VAYSRDQRPARLSFRPLPQARVEVRVQVGAVGDRSGSERLLDELQKELSAGPGR
jgi:hypothetical protein